MYDPGAAGGFTAVALAAGIGSLTYAGFHAWTFSLLFVAVILAGLVVLRAAAQLHAKRGGRS